MPTNFARRILVPVAGIALLNIGLARAESPSLILGPTASLPDKYTTVTAYSFATPAQVGGAGVAIGRVREGSVDRAVRFDATGAALLLGLSPNNAAAAWAVSPNGTAVGSSMKTGPDGAALGTRAVRWEPGSTAPMELDVLELSASGGGTGTAYGVNCEGTTVGYVVTSGGPRSGYHAVRWDPHSSVAVELAPLPDPSGGKPFAQAYSVNAGGTIIGGSATTGDRAVRWDAGSTIATELFVSGSQSVPYSTTFAYAISGAGVIAGTTGVPVTMPRAIRWDAGSAAGTSLQGLGTPSSGLPESAAYAVDASGAVYGYARTYSSSGQAGHIRAVRWAANSIAPTILEIPTDLTAIEGGTVVRDANALGAASGATVDDGAFNGNYLSATRALVWTAGGQLIDLNAFISPPDVGSLVMKDARSIDDTGWVSGIAIYDPDGAGGQAATQRLFQLLIPEAGTYGRGDANFDTQTGFADLVVLAQNYNLTNSTQATNVADFDLNGVTDFKDLVVLAQNYSASVANIEGLGSAAFAADWTLARSLVPEPTCLALTTLTYTLVARRRRIG